MHSAVLSAPSLETNTVSYNSVPNRKGTPEGTVYPEPPEPAFEVSIPNVLP